MEKHFDEDLKINTSMNQYLYEYEVNSILAYSFDDNKSLQDLVTSQSESKYNEQTNRNSKMHGCEFCFTETCLLVSR